MYEGLVSRTAEGAASEVREDVGRRTQGKHRDLANHVAWEKKKKKYIIRAHRRRSDGVQRAL